uniref:Alpha-2-macroglobulin bait region domain-containing protein n=1 Tax=Knipowitschia caucasica TaxID=637954 RepID=A0AAV2J4P3_KNICA
MGRPGMQMETWVLFVAFGCMCVGQALADLLYFVPVPAVWESGAQVRFCASLLKVDKNDKHKMTVTLLSPELNTTLLQKESNQDFHTCSTFLAPLVIKDTVQHFQVEVIGKKMYSRETRKVLIRANKPVTFIQTDKPIFLPGQTVYFRVVTMDTKLRPACRKYDIIELQDPHGNRIGQWLNLTAEGKIVQRSFALNFEAKEGSYQLSVTSGEDTIYHSFKVEKYVLPKFDVKITSKDEVSIAQEEISIKACAEYTYKQPVPGIVKIDVCRPINRYMFGFSRNEDDVPSVTAPCHKESKTADATGCAVFTIPMSTFKEIDQKALLDTLEVVVDMEEEGTGITFTQHKRVTISFVVGTLSFFDTPNIYEKDSTLQGKVKAVAYNEQPLVNKALYLFEGERWSSRHLQNLTTDNNGVATFSLDTSAYSGEIHLHISITPELEYPKYREEHYENGEIRVAFAQQSTLDTKTVSSLEVKKNSEPFPCDTEQDIFINYSVVKEMEAEMDIMYLVYGRDTIVTHGLKRIQVKPNTVTEGSFSFKLQITADLAPVFNVVTYALLPSQFPIAHSATFETEKCFNHKVKLDFTPAQGVPGEKASLRVTASASSLCGISVIDQSVLIQEPDRYLKPETVRMQHHHYT